MGPSIIDMSGTSDLATISNASEWILTHTLKSLQIQLDVQSPMVPGATRRYPRSKMADLASYVDDLRGS